MRLLVGLVVSTVLCGWFVGEVAVAGVSAEHGDGTGRGVVDPPHTAGTVGVDRVGSDLPNMPVLLPSTASSMECATLCIQTAGCVAWAFQPVTCPNQTLSQLHYLEEDEFEVILGDEKRRQADVEEMKTTMMSERKEDQDDHTSRASLFDPHNLIVNDYIKQSRSHYQQTLQRVLSMKPLLSSSSSEQSQCWLKESIPVLSPNPCRSSGVPAATLLAPSFQLVPLPSSFSIQPRGWLQQQLQTQMNGLAGHLQLFWNDVQNSVWLGGTDDTGMHERLPYWINAVMPMLYQLKSTELTEQHTHLNENTTVVEQSIEKFIAYILQHQRDDGWLGPSDDYNPWPRWPVLMALIHYMDNHPSQHTALVSVMYRFLAKQFDLLLSLIASPSASIAYDWWNVRVQDLQITLQYLFDHENGDGSHTQFLLDFMEVLQVISFDWKNWFRTYMPMDSVNSGFNMSTHGVNTGMALKAFSIMYRFTHSSDDYKAAHDATSRLYLGHGQASGIFGCDEHLTGLQPQRGTELCTVVETMFSFSTQMWIFGEASWGDRVEQLTFNALPATMTPDTWAHQYLQQSNEINAQVCDPHVWMDDGPYSTVYGLEPNYGCCTANFGQGWPKFVTHMYMLNVTSTQSAAGAAAAAAAGDFEEVVVTLYGPSVFNSSAFVNSDDVDDDENEESSSASSRIIITQNTTYPFCSSPCPITFLIDTTRSFRLRLRVPWFARSPQLKLPDGSIRRIVGSGARFEVVDIDAGVTGVVQTVTLFVDMPLRVERRFNNAASIYYGPLLMALNIEYTATVLASYAFDSRDWQFEPNSTWTYALQLLDDASPEKDLQVHVGSIPQPYVFDFNEADNKPAVWLTGHGRMITWPVVTNAAGAPPTSPVATNSTLEPIQLVPFGVSKLRIAEIPTVNF